MNQAIIDFTRDLVTRESGAITISKLAASHLRGWKWGQVVALVGLALVAGIIPPIVLKHGAEPETGNAHRAEPESAKPLSAERAVVRSRLAADAIFARSSPAVVQVVTQGGQGYASGSGSGFLVGNRLIATNYHVIKKANRTHVVLADRTNLPVLGVAALDEEADIAIIMVADQIPAKPLELAVRNLPRVGTKVYAIGTPLGLFANTLSDGLVSGHREIGRLTLIQTTAPISPGSSGGPLLGTDGKVVGVTTSFFQGGQNINIAVPAFQVAKLLLRCEGEEVQLTPFPLVRQPDLFVYINRGNVWIDKQEYDEAIKNFDEAIRLDPDYAPTYTRRGYAWLEKKEYDWAIRDFDEAIRLDPHIALYYLNRGYAWSMKKDYDKAMKDLGEAIRLDPKYVLAYALRGSAWMEKEDYARAIEDCNTAIRLDPNCALAYYTRGLAWSGMKNYERATWDWDKASRLDPKRFPR